MFKNRLDKSKNKQNGEIRETSDAISKTTSARSRFLANISHEIRTPINTIMGMNEMALREDATGVPEDYHRAIMNYSLEIKNASEVLLRLIDDLIDMSELESGRMQIKEQEYDIRELLHSITTLIRAKCAVKELPFEVNADEILPRKLYGDADKIRHVIITLLINSVKYTDIGGISLGVSLKSREDDVCELVFSVKDNGIGIPEESKDKVFKAIDQLDDDSDTTIREVGLGLDIAKKYADELGATLTFDSVFGEGTEFILTVTQKIIDDTPAGVFAEYDENVAEGPYVPRFIAPDADILIVDDNPNNLNVVKGLLKATKVFVTTATSGEECIEKLANSKFNVVFMDILMVGMDGVETVAKIREEHKDIPVYAITSEKDKDEDYYRSKGFTGFLTEPVDSETLEKTIMKHLPEKMMENLWIRNSNNNR